MGMGELERKFSTVALWVRRIPFIAHQVTSGIYVLTARDLWTRPHGEDHQAAPRLGGGGGGGGRCSVALLPARWG